MDDVTRNTSAPGDLDTEVWKVMAVVTLGPFMTHLDSTVVNVALPTIQQQFQAPVMSAQWIISGYLLALALMLPLNGWRPPGSYGPDDDRQGRGKTYGPRHGVFRRAHPAGSHAGSHRRGDNLELCDLALALLPQCADWGLSSWIIGFIAAGRPRLELETFL